MSNETAPLLSSYHDEQRERTQQLLATQQSPSSAQGEHSDDVYPVDHGRVAWMQVLGGFILFANSWYISSIFPSVQATLNTDTNNRRKGAFPTLSASSKLTILTH